ncbi:extracellular solute-binding protein [Cutibacterium acnes JCM 18918]|nr:extracellular solute-binding protein [Cutibacterium acnes JCM 18918]
MAEKSHGTMPLISIAPALGDLAAQGVKVYKDGKFTFNTDQAVEIIQKYVELYAKKLCRRRCCRTITSVTRSCSSRARLRGPLARPPSLSTSRRAHRNSSPTSP